MQCPKCKKEIEYTRDRIYKKGKQNLMESSCPYCSSVVSEKKLLFGQKARILFIILFIPTVFILFFLFGQLVECLLRGDFIGYIKDRLIIFSLMVIMPIYILFSYYLYKTNPAHKHNKNDVQMADVKKNKDFVYKTCIFDNFNYIFLKFYYL